MGWQFGWAPPPPPRPRPRKRPLDHVPVVRPILKYVMLSGGPLDGRLVRVPRDHNGIGSPRSTAAYRDSGEQLDGYDRFDPVESP